MGQTTPARPQTNSGAKPGGSGTRPNPKRTSKGRAEEPKQGGLGILIAAGVAVVAIIVGVVWLFGSKNTDTTKSVDDAKQFQTSTITGDKLPDTPDNDGVVDSSIGKTVPKVMAKDFQGKESPLIQAGKPTLLTFAAHWCPHCNKEVPLITKLINGNKLSGIDAVVIATGTDATRPNYPPSDWLASEQWPARVAVDDQAGSIHAAFGGGGYPTMVFVDKDGKVVARMTGEQPEARLTAVAAQTVGATPAG
jgi:thiol-disulfide isomerase/thioredoxin